MSSLNPEPSTTSVELARLWFRNGQLLQAPGQPAICSLSLDIQLKEGGRWTWKHGCQLTVPHGQHESPRISANDLGIPTLDEEGFRVASAIATEQALRTIKDRTRESQERPEVSLAFAAELIARRNDRELALSSQGPSKREYGPRLPDGSRRRSWRKLALAQPLVWFYRLWTRYASKIPGRGILLNIALLSRRLGARMPTVSGPNGMQLELGGDYLTRSVLANGIFEPRLMNWLRRVTRPGDTFIDVGANVGYVSIFASSWVGPNGRVIAFEPSRKAHERLQHNLEMNGCSNVLPVNVGCSSVTGEVTLRTPGRDLGRAHVGPARFADESAETISITTLDQFIASNAISRIGVIKIDVEGHDIEVLRGGMAVIEGQRPAVLIEVGVDPSRPLGASIGDVLALLEPLRYQCILLQDESAYDLLCLPVERSQERYDY